MNSKGWLVRRAVLAIALMIGFYALALGIAGALLWIPYAELIYIGRIHLKIAAICVGAAGTVLWAILPRLDRFTPPGPRLDEKGCPELFRMIREVAAATRQPEPADVYLLNDVNAWVTHRGGIMGMGSRRVMGIGLPLLQGLSELELKAVIAHEFGHYASGDVSLGPWIYKTRAAIGRAIAGVHDSLLEAPFQWYGTLFLKITHGVSRQQEFIADQVAAKVAGASALASALRQVTALSPAFNSYLGNELVPVLRAGFLPPIARGFSQFLQDERIAEFNRRTIAEAEREDTTNEFDTHPSLKQRLEALGESGRPSAPSRGASAASKLLPDLERQAVAVARFAFGAERIENLEPLAWESVGESVLLPTWRSMAGTYAALLGRFTPDMLPTGDAELIRMGADLSQPGEEGIDDNVRIGRAVHVLGVGVGLALMDQGWQISALPGKPVLLIRGAQVVNPFATVRGLASGALDAAEWKAQCAVAGISGRPLGAANHTTAAAGEPASSW